MNLQTLPLDPAIAHALSGVTTATLTTVLLKKGLRKVWMRGARPLRPSQGRASSAAPSRCASCRRARTWPRPTSWASPISTRAAIEAMPAGCVAVVDAHGHAATPASSATSCARAWSSAASPAW